MRHAMKNRRENSNFSTLFSSFVRDGSIEDRHQRVFQHGTFRAIIIGRDPSFWRAKGASGNNRFVAVFFSLPSVVQEREKSFWELLAKIARAINQFLLRRTWKSGRPSLITLGESFQQQRGRIHHDEDVWGTGWTKGLGILPVSCQRRLPRSSVNFTFPRRSKAWLAPSLLHKIQSYPTYQQYKKNQHYYLINLRIIFLRTTKKTLCNTHYTLILVNLVFFARYLIYAKLFLSSPVHMCKNKVKNV